MEAERHQVNCELSNLIDSLMIGIGPSESDEGENESTCRQTCLMMHHSSSPYDNFLMGHTKYFCQEIDGRRILYERIEEENRTLNERLQVQAEEAKQRDAEHALEIQSYAQRHAALLHEIADLTARLNDERSKAEEAAAASSAALAVLALLV